MTGEQRAPMREASECECGECGDDDRQGSSCRTTRGCGATSSTFLLEGSPQPLEPKSDV